MFCVALVTHKLTIIYEINDSSAKYVNLKKKFVIRRFGLSPSSGIKAEPETSYYQFFLQIYAFCTKIINFVDYCKLLSLYALFSFLYFVVCSSDVNFLFFFILLGPVKVLLLLLHKKI